MKTRILIPIIVIIGIIGAVSLYYVYQLPHYSLEIEGMKDTYFVGEEYSFYYTLSGFGNNCGSWLASFPDQNGDIIQRGEAVDCIRPTNTPFSYDSRKDLRKFSSIVPAVEGIYNVTVSVEKIKEPAVHEFEVISPESEKPSNTAKIDEEWPTGGILEYEKTIPVTNETYLSKTVQEWQDTPTRQLEAEHVIRGDDFYIELGKLLVKNEMTYQLQRLGIVNANDDFEPHMGVMLTSLPPHIFYEALVNSTDNKTYHLQGGALANRVNYYKTEELKFYDTAQEMPLESILTKPQQVTILPEEGHNPRVKPNNVIIHIDDNKIEFFNNSPMTVRIQASGSGKISEEGELDWIGPTLEPNQRGSVTFNATGIYEWDVRTAPETDYPDWWGTYGGGSIVVLSDDTNNLPFEEKLKMAGTIIMESEIPRTGLGMGNSKGLTISFNNAIHEMLPDAKQYYAARADQLIPFDVPVIIEEPYIEN